LNATNVVGTLTNNTTGNATTASGGWPTQWPVASITNANWATNTPAGIAAAEGFQPATNAAPIVTSQISSGNLSVTVTNTAPLAASNLIGLLPQSPTVQIATNASSTGTILASPDGANRVWITPAFPITALTNAEYGVLFNSVAGTVYPANSDTTNFNSSLYLNGVTGNAKLGRMTNNSAGTFYCGVVFDGFNVGGEEVWFLTTNGVQTQLQVGNYVNVNRRCSSGVLIVLPAKTQITWQSGANGNGEGMSNSSSEYLMKLQ
jgi:hypothetical protein